MASMSITPFHLYMTCDVYNLFFMPLLHQKKKRKNHRRHNNHLFSSNMDKEVRRFFSFLNTSYSTNES